MVVVIALVLAMAVRSWVFQSFYIPSGSMLPTLQIGDRILVDKLSYRLHLVHEGDIVVFRKPATDVGDPAVVDLVKRVIGLPGETISSAGGNVYIDGHLLKEPWLGTGVITNGIKAMIIPQNSYFVLGDNRGNSSDSRVFGPIQGKLIVGRVVLIFYPFSQFHLFM